jgi:hypothetical protein
VTVQAFNRQHRMTNNDSLLRQQRILMRSEQLRLSLSGQAQVLTKPLALADQVQTGLQWVRHNPKWPLVGLLALIALRPRRSVIWAGRLWWAWGNAKRAQKWLDQFPTQKP